MTRDEAVTLLVTRFGNRANDTNLVTQASIEMMAAQTRLEHAPFLPEMLLNTLAATIEQGDSEIPLPADFLRESDNSRLFCVNSNDVGQKVKKCGELEFNAITETFWEVESTPNRYMLRGLNIAFPQPSDGDYNLKLQFYYKADTRLTTNVTNLWLTHYPDLLIAETAIELLKYIVAPTAVASYFIASREEQRIAMQVNEIARKSSGRKSSMGGLITP